MRLIDADELRLTIQREYNTDDSDYPTHYQFGLHFAMNAIDEAQTVEPKRIKGRWTEKTVSENPQVCGIREWQSAKCSVCGKYHSTPYLYSFTEYAFCPHCGSDMRGDEE